MTRRLLPLLLVLAFAGCASVDPLPEDQTPKSRYMGNVGAYPVGSIPDIALQDAARGRELILSIDYPIYQGSFPLVVLTPAYGATSRHYVGLSAHWASQGYVVVRMTHPAERRELNGNASGTPVAMPRQTPADWSARAGDVQFVLDSTEKLARQYPELQGKLDATKVGVAGHSYGAFIAMLLGGVKTFPGAASYVDPRVTAVLAISPQGPSDSAGLTNESYASLTVPTMFMIGTQDAGPGEEETTAWRRRAFELAAPGNKWLVVIEGATHRTFAGVRDQLAAAPDPTFQPNPQSTRDPLTRPSDDPRRPGRESAAGMYERNRFAAVRSLTLAFWDAYLRNDPKGRETLDNSASRVLELKTR